MRLTKRFKELVRSYLGLDNIFLFWKGRVALYAILKAIGIEKGDEVILPALTCVVVPNPVIYSGARPVYVDVDPKTFNIAPEKIEAKITPKTRVILAQNTFGLSSDLDSIKEIAQKHNLIVIEDCAHGFGGTYKGKKNGTVAEAAFFSSQWNKPFSTGLGGIAVTKNEEIARKLASLEESAIKPSKKEEAILKLLLTVRERFISPKTFWIAVDAYRFLSKESLILGSSQGYELKSPKMPSNFFKGFSETQAKVGLKYFEKVDGSYEIDLIIKRRKKVANRYKEILKDLGLNLPFEPGCAEHTYLKFPLLVRDRERFFHLARKEKIELGDWFLSPIHPVKSNFELWNYHYGENPIAEFISEHIINLPTNENIDEKEIERIYQFLKKNRDWIMEYPYG